MSGYEDYSFKELESDYKKALKKFNKAAKNINKYSDNNRINRIKNNIACSKFNTAKANLSNILFKYNSRRIDLGLDPIWIHNVNNSR